MGAAPGAHLVVLGLCRRSALAPFAASDPIPGLRPLAANLYRNRSDPEAPGLLDGAAEGRAGCAEAARRPAAPGTADLRRRLLVTYPAGAPRPPAGRMEPFRRSHAAHGARSRLPCHAVALDGTDGSDGGDDRRGS